MGACQWLPGFQLLPACQCAPCFQPAVSAFSDGTRAPSFIPVTRAVVPCPSACYGALQATSKEEHGRTMHRSAVQGIVEQRSAGVKGVLRLCPHHDVAAVAQPSWRSCVQG